MSQFKVEVDKWKNKCSNCHGKGFYYIAISKLYTVRYKRYLCEVCKGTGILSKEQGENYVSNSRTRIRK